MEEYEREGEWVWEGEWVGAFKGEYEYENGWLKEGERVRNWADAVKVKMKARGGGNRRLFGQNNRDREGSRYEGRCWQSKGADREARERGRNE